MEVTLFFDILRQECHIRSWMYFLNPEESGLSDKTLGLYGCGTDGKEGRTVCHHDGRPSAKC